MDEKDERLEDFGDAREATEGLFGAEQEALEEPEAEAPAQEEIPEPPAGGQELDPMQVTETAVQTAEAAAQAAAQKDSQLQQVMQELTAMKEQNQTLQQTLQQMSEQQKESIVDEAMALPELDLSGLAFEDEETVRQRQAEYAQRMAEYVNQNVMKELSPFVDQAKEGLREKEKNQALAVLAGVPELQGIQEMIPQLDTIIQNNPAIFSDDVPVDEKYITAYAIAKGANSINNPPKEPSPEELMKYYESNPEFRDMIEKKRVDQIKGSQQVPPLSASNGAVNAALNIKEKPKTFDEASRRTREMFT